MLLCGEKANIDYNQIIDYARENEITIAGAIFPRVINDKGHEDDGVILKYFHTSVEPILLKEIGSGNMELNLRSFGASQKACIVLFDGLMQNIPRFLERLYEQYWNTIKFVGGGCGSLSLQQQPCIFTKEGMYQDAALLIPVPLNARLGVEHGWKKLAGPFVANKTDGNKIIELNWRPAFEVYKEQVEAVSTIRFDGQDFFSISKGFPFGIYKEGQEDIVRDPLSVDKNGTLTCVGHVSQNVSLNILMGEHENLIASARRAAEETLKGQQPKEVFLVDCISRVLYLEDRFNEELNSIKAIMKEERIEPELEGVLSLGEVSSAANGFLELYNKTCVVSIFN